MRELFLYLVGLSVVPKTAENVLGNQISTVYFPTVIFKMAVMKIVAEDFIEILRLVRIHWTIYFYPL